jgi:hypothetical protein
MVPESFLQGSRCPICAESKGEQKIRHWLNNNNINNKLQYTFNDLLSDKGNPLRFDFGILDKNNKLKLLIEYDGEGHYKEKPFGKDSYKLITYHDQLKNEYCNRNNIQLVRIPYWKFDDIENILGEISL